MRQHILRYRFCVSAVHSALWLRGEWAGLKQAIET